MGRIRTIGFEANGLTFSIDNFLEGGYIFGVPTTDTTTFRSGAKSLRCNSGAGNTDTHMDVKLKAAEQVVGRSYYLRTYIYIDTLPSNDNCSIITVYAGTSDSVCSVNLRSNGVLRFMRGSPAVQVGSDTASLSLNTWYRIELYMKTDVGATDEVEMRLDGITVGSATSLTLSDSSVSIFQLGWVASGPGANRSIYYDDMAINNNVDDGSGLQNSWPGPGKIVLLKPISDVQAGTWTGGAGGTTNLFDAIDNTPPLGTSSETNLTQIENVDTSPDNSTDEYRATMTSYFDAGIGGEDEIVLVQPLVDSGEDAGAGTKTGSFAILSNPTQATVDTFTAGANAGALGTWPSNWDTQWGAAQSSPIVDVSTSPVMALRKTDTGNRVLSVDFMGIYVEYIDYVPVMQARMDFFGPIATE